MMNYQQKEVLDKCVELILNGSSLDDCFRQFPDLTPEIRKMLMTAFEVGTLREDIAPTEAMKLSRMRLLSRVRALKALDIQGVTEGRWIRLVKAIKRLLQGIPDLSPVASRLLVIVGMTGLLILFSGSLVVTSAKSLPGDSLYPVKRAVEDLRVRLVINKEVRNEYEESYDQERVSEVESLLNLKRAEPISFEGVLESIGINQWVVSGIRVVVSETTNMVNPSMGSPAFQVGVVVEVYGITNGQGWVTATRINLRQYQFYGVVDKITRSSWQISGTQLDITEDTLIESDLQVGDEVSVIVRSEDTGLIAMEIQHAGHPSATPGIQETVPEIGTQPEVPDEDEVYQATGKLEQINAGMWLVSGQEYYLTGDTHIEGELRVGDVLEIKYRILANGNYIAVEIKQGESYNLTEEYQVQETPTPGEGEDHHETPVITKTAEDEHKAGQTPVPTQTLEPHDH